MPDVHGLVELALTVGGADTDTQVTVAAWAPDAIAPTALTAWPQDPAVRDRWSANLVPDAAGTWRILWTVTGSGAGVVWDELQVAPAPGGTPGRSYASTAQLAAWLEDEVPAGAGKMLRRATTEIDGYVRCAVYDVDQAGMPTDPAVAAALADAVCAQVEWWDELGETGTGASRALAGAQIGSVKLGAGVDASTASGVPAGCAPAAWSALQRAGLTGHGPTLPGRHVDVIRQGPQ